MRKLKAQSNNVLIAAVLCSAAAALHTAGRLQSSTGDLIKEDVKIARAVIFTLQHA